MHKNHSVRFRDPIEADDGSKADRSESSPEATIKHLEGEQKV